MKWFTGHRVLREKDGSTVVLYLNQYLTEFSAEFFHNQKQSYDTSIEDSAYSYIKSNIPNINLKKIKIMLGSLTLANITSPKITSDKMKNNRADINLNNISYYTVKPNDTLVKIANLYNTTVASLKTLNNINKIFIGQTLKIYGNARARYFVKENDSAEDIAKSFNVTINHLKYVNNVENIEPKQQLIIPRQESELFVNMLPEKELNKDSKGVHVKRLQLALYLCGHYIEINGIFGKGTESVIYKLQSNNKIRPTGKYNESTKSLISKIILGYQKIIKNPDDALVLVNKNNRLPFNYIPRDLIVPHVQFNGDISNNQKLLRKDVALNLYQLFNKAQDNNIQLMLHSAYQSYVIQEQMFINYANSHNLKAALTAIAKPGESEYQTGLAVDVVSKNHNQHILTNKYINNNVAKYGFILSEVNKAVDKKTVYHLRFVGKEASQEITAKNITLQHYLHKE
ncbi:LysM peptidoglycan-binding domain-containing protein [Clostridium sp. 'deep sea']|uniref:D-alanyl-D-alanine carboxypeptidase family protein n=1 Tax=Clostridium sp. 'deep sea' TaxID=2779445 RepID=UPI0018966A15|nr:D-alanyl-D-alanine carboxypeptidase family protein [Clostridium sp. 'deep sea']QOR34192.1 LysM peptidoglycan-binding domain-containing protein [Clostridium sp. 'deep sea']